MLTATVMELAQEANQGASSENSAFELIIGPAVTAGLVAAAFSLIQYLGTGRREKKKQRAEFRIRQINEFYSPILFLLAEDLALGQALRESAPNTPGTWYLLDNLDAVRNDAALLRMAKRIDKINLKIRDVLADKAGLSLKSEIPQSYIDFHSHAELVHLGVVKGFLPTNIHVKHFPKAFENEIKADYKALVELTAREIGGTTIRKRIWNTIRAAHSRTWIRIALLIVSGVGIFVTGFLIGR